MGRNARGAVSSQEGSSASGTLEKTVETEDKQNSNEENSLVAVVCFKKPGKSHCSKKGKGRKPVFFVLFTPGSSGHGQKPEKQCKINILAAGSKDSLF